MAFLRRYIRSDVIRGAARLRQEQESGRLGRLDFALESCAFCFRDDQNTYWFLDASADQWFRFEGGQWQRATTAPDMVEGTDDLLRYIGAPDALPADGEDSSDNVKQGGPVMVYRHLLQKARDGYLKGRYTSMDTAMLLTRLYLVDQQGYFWTMGFHSGKWYRAEDKDWAVMDHPPDMNRLAHMKYEGLSCERCGQKVEKGPACPNCGAQVSPQIIGLEDEGYTRMGRFMMLGVGSLPEPVTASWDPPESLPSLQEPGTDCPLCAAHNPPGSRFCNQCGRQLGCPACGKVNRPGSRFCAQCGRSLVEEGAAV